MVKHKKYTRVDFYTFSFFSLIENKWFTFLRTITLKRVVYYFLQLKRPSTNGQSMFNRQKVQNFALENFLFKVRFKFERLLFFLKIEARWLLTLVEFSESFY